MRDIIFPFNNFKEYINKNQKYLILGKDLFIVNNINKINKTSLLDLSNLEISQTKLINTLKSKRPYALFNAEINSKKEFIHHRSSGMNHIIFNKLTEYNIYYLLNLSLLPNLLVMGRMMQNIMLARKSNTRIIIKTFANNKFQLSNEKDISGLLKLLGMNTKEIKNSFF